jgi:hypothetical protein
MVRGVDVAPGGAAPPGSDGTQAHRHSDRLERRVGSVRPRLMRHESAESVPRALRRAVDVAGAAGQSVGSPRTVHEPGTTERRNGAPMKTGSREQVSRGGDGSESLPRRGPPPGSYPLRRRTRRSVRGRVSGPADPASKPSSSTKMPRRAQAGGTDALVSRGRCGGLVVRGLRGRHARRYLLHGNRESSVAASRRKECRR